MCGSFSEEKKNHSAVSLDRLTVYFANPDGHPKMPRDMPEDFLVALRTAFPPEVDAVKDRPWIVPVWRGMWRLATLFQDLPGFHVVFSGLNDLSGAVAASPKKVLEEAAWNEIAGMLFGRGLSVLEALRAAGAPRPYMVGADVMVGDMICSVQI